MALASFASHSGLNDPSAETHVSYKSPAAVIVDVESDEEFFRYERQNKTIYSSTQTNCDI